MCEGSRSGVRSAALKPVLDLDQSGDGKQPLSLLETRQSAASNAISATLIPHLTGQSIRVLLCIRLESSLHRATGARGKVLANHMSVCEQ